MCDELVLANGNVSYSNDQLSFGSEANHSCSDGFVLVGDMVRVCGGNGSSAIGDWSLEPPVCSRTFTDKSAVFPRSYVH